MLVDIEGLGKQFGDRTLFTDLNYSFAEGKVNVILGESGSGKTTLLNMIALYEPPDYGEIRYDGVLVSGKSMSDSRRIIRKYVGYIYQDIRLFDSLSVNDNILLALRFSTISRKKWQSSINDLLERMGLFEYRDKPAGQLSGGEKQRIAIARAVASGKKLLLADEPTGALDEDNSRVIVNLMKEISKNNGSTIIMVTHSKMVADEFSDRCWLRSGELQIDKGVHHEG